MGAKESPPWVSRKEASLNGVQSLLHCPAEQSGTKPNLVDKILSTKFGLFCYMYKMFSKILWFSASPWLRCEHLKIWRATNCASFFRKLTSMAGTNEFFKACAPMSSVKSHTPMDVKLHWAQCVKSNYNRMEPFPIGQIWTTQIVSNLQVWTTIVASHLTREPTVSPVLTKWWNWELTLATNFSDHGYQIWLCTRLLRPSIWILHLRGHFKIKMPFYTRMWISNIQKSWSRPS